MKIATSDQDCPPEKLATAGHPQLEIELKRHAPNANQ
jgi:hypothetical protein